MALLLPIHHVVWEVHDICHRIDYFFVGQRAAALTQCD
jgi:hypothetical protein